MELLAGILYNYWQSQFKQIWLIDDFQIYRQIYVLQASLSSHLRPPKPDLHSVDPSPGEDEKPAEPVYIPGRASAVATGELAVSDDVTAGSNSYFGEYIPSVGSIRIYYHW